MLRIQQEIGADIALSDVFATPVLADLADRVLSAQLARFDPDALARIAGAMREHPLD